LFLLQQHSSSPLPRSISCDGQGWQPTPPKPDNASSHHGLLTRATKPTYITMPSRFARLPQSPRKKQAKETTVKKPAARQQKKSASTGRFDVGLAGAPFGDTGRPQP
jgi:hypothetical protein